MNKLTKLLSVFILAGAVGAGVAGVSACKSNDDNNEPTHTHNYTYTPNNDGTHNGTCNGEGTCDAPTISNEACVDNKNNETQAAGADGKCDKCGANVEQSSQLEVAANVTGLLIEGVTQETITLSETNQSHTIDKSAVKVYFATGNNADVKGDAVPADNLVLELKDDKGAAVSSWEGIRKDGVYKVNASLKNAKMASGALVTVDDLKATVTVTVSNPVKAGSLVVKAGEGVLTTQQQTAVNSILPTWTYEVTLANGDKQDVPASEVTVSGLYTTKITDNGVATLTWGEITGTQSYTITANENLVSQSFALNFGELTADQKTKLKTEDVSIQEGRFVVQATSGEVADHRGSAPDFDGKYLASRLKLGGKYDGDNAKRYIKITTDGEATITVYGYANTGTAGNGAANRYLTLFKDVTFGPKGGTDASKIVATGSNPVGEKQNTLQKENSKHEFTVTEAGTYWLVCEAGDVCITYLQVDQLVTKGEGVEEKPLPAGEDKLIKLSVSSATADYKQTFTLGDPFSVSNEYTFTGVYYNTVTMKKVKEEAVTNVTYWLGDNQLTTETTLTESLITTLGEQKITVKVDGETEVATYTVIVESAVPGVTGITASVKDTVVTEVETAEGTVSLNKSDVEVAIKGTSTTASAELKTVKYRLASAAAGSETEITADAAASLGVGEYKLIVTATVSTTDAGVTPVDFTVEIDFKVSQKVAAGDLQNVVSTGADTTKIIGTYTQNVDLLSTDSGKIFITAGAEGNVVIEANNKTIDGVAFTDRIKLGGTGTTTYRSVGFEVKAGATIEIYAVSSSSSADRNSFLLDSAGNKLSTTATVVAGAAPAKYTFTVDKAGTYYFIGEGGGINVYGASIIYNAS